MCELFKNAKNAHACALQDCLGVSWLFVSDTSLKQCIDYKESPGKTPSRQGKFIYFYKSCLHGEHKVITMQNTILFK